MSQQGIDFCRMGCRMDAGEDNLVFPDEIKFPFFQFLYFCHKITVGINFFHRIDNFSTFCRISFIRKASPLAGIFLDPYFRTCAGDHGDFCRSSYDAVFISFNIFQYAKFHE